VDHGSLEWRRYPVLPRTGVSFFDVNLHGQLEADHVDIMNNWPSVDLDDWNLGALGALEYLESGIWNLEIWNLETQKNAEAGPSLRRIVLVTIPAAGRPAHEPVIVLVMTSLRQRSNGRETLQMILPACAVPDPCLCRFRNGKPGVVDCWRDAPNGVTLKGPTMSIQCTLHSS
jgi:hypothetical protein